MTTDHWAIFMEAFTTSTPWRDPHFPILDFLTEVLSTGSLSSKFTKFLRTIRARLKSTDPATKTHSYNTGREVDYDPIWDRKAKVNVSISLPQYDGANGKAAKFVAKFTHLATNQNFPEREWDSLLMDCLKKEALKHFENSRMKFQSHKLYFQALISFFDHRSVNDEKKWYRDTFKQRNGEAPRTFYLRFLETITHLQTLDLFLDDDAPGFDCCLWMTFSANSMMNVTALLTINFVIKGGTQRISVQKISLSELTMLRHSAPLLIHW